MDLRINGKRALVLAAAGGLGSAVCASLAAEGVNLLMADMNAQALEDAAAAIKADFPVSVETQVCDLGAAASVEALIEKITGEAHSIDILINITGGPPPGTASEIDADPLRKYFESMVISVIRV